MRNAALLAFLSYTSRRGARVNRSPSLSACRKCGLPVLRRTLRRSSRSKWAAFGPSVPALVGDDYKDKNYALVAVEDYFKGLQKQYVAEIWKTDDEIAKSMRPGRSETESQDNYRQRGEIGMHYSFTHSNPPDTMSTYSVAAVVLGEAVGDFFARCRRLPESAIRFYGATSRRCAIDPTSEARRGRMAPRRCARHRLPG